MIEAQSIEFDLNVNIPSEVIAAIYGKLSKFPFAMSVMPAQLMYKTN
jgi:hypothetical protein